MRKNDAWGATQPFGQGVGHGPPYDRHAFPPRRPAPQGHGNPGVQQPYDGRFARPPMSSSHGHAAHGLHYPLRRPDPPRPSGPVYGFEDSVGGFQQPYGGAYDPRVGSNRSPPFRQPWSSDHDGRDDSYAYGDGYPAEHVPPGAAHGAGGGYGLYGGGRPTTAYHHPPRHAFGHDGHDDDGRRPAAWNQRDASARWPPSQGGGPWHDPAPRQRDASPRVALEVTVALHSVDAHGQLIYVVFESDATLIEVFRAPCDEASLRRLAETVLLPASYGMLLRWLSGSQPFTVRAVVDGGQPFILANERTYSLLVGSLGATGRRVDYAYCCVETKTDVVSAPASLSVNAAANARFAEDADFFCPQRPRGGERTSDSRKAGRRDKGLPFTFPNGTRKKMDWTMKRPTSSRRLIMTSEVSAEFRYAMARDALREASVVDLVAQTPDARHATIYFEEDFEGQVSVHIFDAGALIIWPDIVGLLELREKVMEALYPDDVDEEAAIAVAPHPFAVFCPMCGRLARSEAQHRGVQRMNALNMLVSHMKECEACRGDDARRGVERLDRLLRHSSLGPDKTRFPPPRVALRRLPVPNDVLRIYPPGVVVAAAAAVLDALLRSGALAASHPMAERVQVFGRVVSGADPGGAKFFFF